jgi:hypothetical protein
VPVEATGRTTETYARNAAGSAVAATQFVEADPASVVEGVSADDFFNKAYDKVLLPMINHVVEVEGPVLDAVLARRIARAHGWQRTGARIQERVVALAASAHRGTTEEVGAFFWPSRLEPGSAVRFRRATEDSTRSVDEVCLPELVALAQDVLSSGLKAEAAVLAMARELGLQRLRATSRSRFEAAMAQAQAEVR